MQWVYRRLERGGNGNDIVSLGKNLPHRMSDRYIVHRRLALVYLCLCGENRPCPENKRHCKK